MKFITKIEEILLLAIWKLKDQAYGIAIREQVEKDTGIRWISGAIYAPLSRLRKNRFVSTEQADGSAEMGGRPRIYYSLTKLGKEKLVTLQEMNRVMWTDVPDLKNEF